MQHIKIGVIGGGAAGMTAAITAAWQGAEVTLLEGGERVGKKILSTGNGKCNLGNLMLDATDYCGSSNEWLEKCLAQFDSMDMIRFFRSLGLMIKEKNGYLYPVSEQAATVLDVLRTELKALGIRVVTDCKVDHIKKEENGHFLVSSGSNVFSFEKVILACGGQAAPKTGSDGSGYRLAQSLGHTVIPVVPALVQLKCREKYLKEVAGVRAEARIRVVGLTDSQQAALTEEELTEHGELQLTDYGISGIPVFQLSRKINYLLANGEKEPEVEVAIDFLPDYEPEEYAVFCEGRRLTQTDRSVEEFFTGMLHKKLMRLFLKQAGVKADQPLEEVSPEQIERVFAFCKDWRLHVTGSNSFENAQVCAGGVDTAEVGIHMESKRVKGLFFAGEILDVDGRCGGYNLHWAWCSGSIAGEAAVRTDG